MSRVFWADVDASGAIIEAGSGEEGDVELRPVAPGLERKIAPHEVFPWSHRFNAATGAFVLLQNS